MPEQPNSGQLDIESRLQGYLDVLKAVKLSGTGMSSATIGRERELFINLFLSQVFPPSYRLGSGDIVDHLGHHSGQVDIVIETPFLPSFPLAGTCDPRLYLFEGVAMALEVKSHLDKDEWSDIVKKAEKLLRMKPAVANASFAGAFPPARQGMKEWSVAPLIVVCYSGWSLIQSAREKLEQDPVLGILNIENEYFVSYCFPSLDSEGPKALGNFIACVMCHVGYQLSMSLDWGKYLKSNSPWDFHVPSTYFGDH